MNSFISARFELETFLNCFNFLWSLSFSLYSLVKSTIGCIKCFFTLEIEEKSGGIIGIAV